MILLGLMAAAWTVMAQEPKREFRGAWLNTIYRGEYAKMSAEECKKYLSLQLDKLHSAGVNAVFFQVRPRPMPFIRRSSSRGADSLLSAAKLRYRFGTPCSI